MTSADSPSRGIERFGLRVAEGGVREQFKGPLLLPNNIESLRNYFAQVSLIDSGVGKILASLERLGLDDDTIIIYTSDHGFSLGHNGVWGHGAAAFPSSAHRPSYHIPLIVSGGTVAENVISKDHVSQIDLFPTLAALAGATDARPSLPSSARDFGPVLKGEKLDDERAIFFEQEETRAIRTKDWLYAQRFKGAASYPMKDELYALGDDPHEKTNLIGAPALADVKSDLSHQIAEFFQTYSHPDYDLWSGGSAKSNVTYGKLWQDAWGPDWTPRFSG